MIRLDALGGEPFDSPLILGRSKDERLAQDGPFDSPLILGRSKDERLAQDRPVEPRAIYGGSSFDKLRTSDVQKRHAHETMKVDEILKPGIALERPRCESSAS